MRWLLAWGIPAAGGFVLGFFLGWKYMRYY
jgi:hypothetical protein